MSVGSLAVKQQEYTPPHMHGHFGGFVAPKRARGKKKTNKNIQVKTKIQQFIFLGMKSEESIMHSLYLLECALIHE